MGAGSTKGAYIDLKIDTCPSNFSDQCYVMLYEKYYIWVFTFKNVLKKIKIFKKFKN